MQEWKVLLRLNDASVCVSKIWGNCSKTGFLYLITIMQETRYWFLIKYRYSCTISLSVSLFCLILSHFFVFPGGLGLGHGHGHGVHTLDTDPWKTWTNLYRSFS